MFTTRLVSSGGRLEWKRHFPAPNQWNIPLHLLQVLVHPDPDSYLPGTILKHAAGDVLVDRHNPVVIVEAVETFVIVLPFTRTDKKLDFAQPEMVLDFLVAVDVQVQPGRLQHFTHLQLPGSISG
jgi:hypothetical protein